MSAERFVVNALSNGLFLLPKKNGQNVLTGFVQGVCLELKMLLLQKW
jgi:predicted RecA/RadA family phage recombinase